MFQRIELVEIFHQFLFLFFFEGDDIALRKFIRVILYSFVDISRLHPIKFSDVSIEDNLRIAKDNNLTLDLFYLLVLSHENKDSTFFGVSSVFPSTFLLAYSSSIPSPFYPYLLIFRTRVPPPAVPLLPCLAHHGRAACFCFRPWRHHKRWSMGIAMGQGGGVVVLQSVVFSAHFD